MRAQANRPAYSASWTAEHTTGMTLVWHEIGPLMNSRGSKGRPEIREPPRPRKWNEPVTDRAFGRER
jgi:hypothetical protein